MGEIAQEVAVRPSFMHKNLPLILTAPVALVLLFFGGCDSDDATRPGPGGDSVQITRFVTDATTLGPGDSTLAYVYVVQADGTTPAVNQEVEFGEMLNKRSGSYSKTSVLTDAAGIATTVFRADAQETGDVTLKARAGSSTAYAMLYLSMTPATDLVLTITSLSGGSAIPADGVSTLPLRVTATYGPNQEPVNGLTVTLVAGDRFIDSDRDGVFSEGDELYPGGDSNNNGSWDALGTLPSTVTTDAAGMADFILHSGTVTGTCYVRATADEATGELPVQFHSTSLQVVVQTGVLEMLADGVSTTQVIAEVSDWGGSPVSGVIVRFTAGEPFEDVGGDGEFTPGTDSFTDLNSNGQWDVIGLIDSYGATGDGGQVIATYTAGIQPGEVRIRATVTGGSAEGRIVLVPVPSASRIEVNAEPLSVFADGRSAIEGEVAVFDINGTPLAGKQVKLVAGEPFTDVDHDGIFTDGTDILLTDLDGDETWTEIGTVDPVCVTGMGGLGYFTYNAGLISGPIMIKATADGVGADLGIDLTALPPVTTMELSRESAEILVRGGGGTDNVLITALCYDALGNVAPAGIRVEFSILSGPRGGEALVDAEEGIYEAWTDADGLARAMLVAGTETGVVEVVATTGSVMRTVQVGIAAGLPHAIEIHADHEILTFWAQTNVCAYVYDLYGNPVRDGTIVLFNVDEGLIEGDDGLGSSEVEHGQACAIYYSLGPALDTDYLAAVEARVQGTTTAGSLEISLEETPPPPITELEISVDRTSVEVRRIGDAEEVLIVTRGFTFDGQAVGAGYPVTFRIESGPQGGEGLNGEGWGPVEGFTNQDGIAQVTFEPGTRPGPVRVTAHSGTANIIGVEIQIVAGPPIDLVCSAIPEEIGSEDISEIRAYLFDEYHNPVQDGVVVSFQVDEGMIVGEDGGSSRTEDGIAIATYYSLTPDPEGDGNAVITCVAEGGALTTQTNVRIPMRSTGLASLHLTVSETELTVSEAGDNDQMEMRVIAYTESGQTVTEGYDIRFEILSGPDGGEALNGIVGGPFTQSTDMSGRSSVTFTSGTNAGNVRIAARHGAIWSNEMIMPIYAGPPAELACWPGDSDLGEDDSTTVFVIIRDLHRNPVTDSTIVTFMADEGRVNGTAYDGALISYTFGGYAKGLYRTFEAVPGGDGWADILVSTQAGPTCEMRIAIPSTSDEASTIWFDAAEAEIGVTGTGAVDMTELRATPKNAQGGTLGPGVEVVFTILSAPAGVMLDGETSSITVATGNDGVARVTLAAGTASGIVNVQVESGSRASNYASVAITAGPPAVIECQAPDSVNCGQQLLSGEVRAYVMDIHHNPVRDGTPVWYTADRGLIVAYMGAGGAGETVSGIGWAWYYAPLASECETWTEATLTFHAGDLICSRKVYQRTGP